MRVAWLIGTFVSHLPADELSILGGLVLCFFGGMYPLCMAAGEALRQCGTHEARALVSPPALSTSIYFPHSPLFSGTRAPLGAVFAGPSRPCRCERAAAVASLSLSRRPLVSHLFFPFFLPAARVAPGGAETWAAVHDLSAQFNTAVAALEADDQKDEGMLLRAREREGGGYESETQHAAPTPPLARVYVPS